jgi:hypothetical protein
MKAGSSRDNRCDKCGQAVAPHNNALAYQAEAGELAWDLAVAAQPRHFAPEGECEGSPSRFQHVVGRPDARGFPAPSAESVAAWRAACCRINAAQCPLWCGEDASRLRQEPAGRARDERHLAS